MWSIGHAKRAVSTLMAPCRDSALCRAPHQLLGVQVACYPTHLLLAAIAHATGAADGLRPLPFTLYKTPGKSRPSKGPCKCLQCSSRNPGTRKQTTATGVTHKAYLVGCQRGSWQTAAGAVCVAPWG
jgi:hypothetical protein